MARVVKQFARRAIGPAARTARTVLWNRVERLIRNHPSNGWNVVVHAARERRHEPTPLTARAELVELLSALHPITTADPLIRLGPAADGGYLVPDCLDDITACFSPGVDTVSGFELDCAERGIDVYLADGSVEAPPETHPRFSFMKRHLGAVTTDQTITIGDWIEHSLGDRPGDLVLQMDIEGAEWEVLPTMPPTLLQRFRVIVIELHHLDDLHLASTFRHMAPVVRTLLQTHACVHIHPNNCLPSVTIDGIELPQVAEFTFVRHDRAEATGHARQFPHPLDVDNTTWRPTMVLPASLRRT
ncbi:MAG: hypothetical protein RI958_2344 [Actinomycetota bacterium]